MQAVAGHDFKKTGLLRAGFRYQDLVAIEVLIEYYRNRHLYDSVTLDSEDPGFGSIEDVVACLPDGRYYKSRTWARKAWQAWYDSAIRCRLEPVKRVARMIKRHLDGIVTAVVTRVTNARAESINAGVQKLKYSARGFRNRKRFRNAIYFHLGGLDLYPAGVDR